MKKLLLLILVFFAQLNIRAEKTFMYKVKTDLGTISFKVHAREEHREFVNILEKASNKIIPNIINYFKYLPKRNIHVVIDDTALSANGLATPFPRNYMRLYTKQPIGSGYLATSINYYQKLFVHEFIHILHLERTEGFPKFVENVFGSIGKVIPSMIPRWFAEGVAMWGEDYFTGEGRLKNPRLIREVKDLLRNKRICENVSCLDDPGVYPGGRLSYWAGGIFLKYLEDIKKGTIACLVKGNSSKFPFFLNMAFRRCTGFSADFHFFNFQKIKDNQTSKVYGNAESGYFFNGEKFYYLKDIDRETFLIERDSKTSDERKISLKKDVESVQNSRGKLRLIVNNHRGPKSTKEIYELNEGSLNTVALDKEYSFDYQGEEISALFVEDHWEIYKGSRVVSKLKPFETLFQPHIQGRSLVYNTVTASGNYLISRVDLKSYKTKRFPVNVGLKLVGQCSDGSYYHTREGNYLRFSNDRFESLKGLKYLYLKEVDGKRVEYADTLKFSKGNCRSLFEKRSREKSPSYSLHSIPKIKTERYSALQYMAPHFWFFTVNSSENDEGYVGITTVMNDPLGKHTLATEIDYYSELEEIGGLFSYTYSPDPTDYLFLTLTYDKVFTSSTANSNDLNFEEEFTLDISKSLFLSNWKFRTDVILGKSRAKDIISTSVKDTYTLLTGLYRFKTYEYSFLQSFSLVGMGTSYNPNDSEKFYGYYGELSFTFDLYKEFNLYLEGTYENLNKKSFSNGVINAGGSLESNHNHVGIAYGDVFGNDVKTFRARFDIPIFRPYYGSGFIPAYLRKVNAVIGRDYIKSDFVYFDERQYFDRSLTTFYYGASFATKLFYLVPLNIELLNASSKVNNGESLSSLQIQITGGIPF